jgi:hypothetical protein
MARPPVAAFPGRSHAPQLLRRLVGDGEGYDKSNPATAATVVPYVVLSGPPIQRFHRDRSHPRRFVHVLSRADAKNGHIFLFPQR